MPLTFVDTIAWYAMVLPTAQDHQRVAQWLVRNRAELITSDYVVDETLTLLRSRGEGRRAIEMGRRFFRSGRQRVLRVGEADLDAAWEVFHRFDDKEWSFTDCTSKVLIESNQIRQALSLDHHFRQFGTVEVFP